MARRPPTNDIEFYLFGNGQTVVFQVQASNGCGTTSDELEWLSADCSSGGWAVAYPLPL